MDLLNGLLGGPRARGAFVLRLVMEPPWSIRVEDQALLSLMVVLKGEAWIDLDDDQPHHLEAGGVAVVRGPEPYLLADDPATPPQVVVDPGQHCRTLGGRPLAEEMSLGVRTWGNSPEGPTVLLIGAYERTSAVGERLLSVLPRLVDLPAGGWSCPLVPVMTEEMLRDEPGQEAVLDRLLDLLLVSALRAWLATDDDGRTSWYRAHHDPTVGRALRLLHNNVAHPWTVASLAAEAGASRALLARRFNDLVGRPPMAYLTDLRLTLAADQLLEPGTTIDAVARSVGYGSAFSLSTAFKRVRGLSPMDHRRTVLAGPSPR